MKRFITGFLIAAAMVLSGCGQKVEVPPAHVNIQFFLNLTF